MGVLLVAVGASAWEHSERDDGALRAVELQPGLASRRCAGATPRDRGA